MSVVEAMGTSRPQTQYNSDLHLQSREGSELELAGAAGAAEAAGLCRHAVMPSCVSKRRLLHVDRLVQLDGVEGLAYRHLRPVLRHDQ